MNCMETAARLHLYIDRELNAEEVAIVQQHLKDCPSCECRFHFDTLLKRLLHERCTIEKAPMRLRALISSLAQTPPGASLEMDPEVEREICADFNLADSEE